MKRMMGFLLVCLLMVPAAREAMAAPVSVAAKGAVLADGNTGRILWEKNSSEPLPIASTTKILTALLVLEEGNLEEEVTVSARAQAAPKVHLGLQEGETYRVGDLLYPLMLESSNDAAIVLAEAVGGSVEGFAEQMNERAAQLGAKDSFFTTPNGLDKGGNHSTAADLALITAAALQNPDFCAIIQTPSYTFSSCDGSRTFTVSNKNRLLQEYDGAIGVKTGFTNLAGQCFVGAAERDGVKLIAVVLQSGWGTTGQAQKWKDAKALLDYGFSNYHYVDAISSEVCLSPVAVERGEEDQVDVTHDQGQVLARTGETFSTQVVCSQQVTAPVAEGEVLGHVSVFDERGKMVFFTEIKAKSEVKKRNLKSYLKKLENDWLFIPLTSIL